MYIAYGGKAGRYRCEGALVNHGTARCISFVGLRTDVAVGRAVLRLLKSLGVEAAAKALEVQTHETSAAQKQLELALAQAQFAAAHARRQYDAVDPANRLIAGKLERRENGRIGAADCLAASKHHSKLTGSAQDPFLGGPLSQPRDVAPTSATATLKFHSTCCAFLPLSRGFFPWRLSVAG
jgi:hypothetical protein